MQGYVVSWLVQSHHGNHPTPSLGNQWLQWALVLHSLLDCGEKNQVIWLHKLGCGSLILTPLLLGCVCVCVCYHGWLPNGSAAASQQEWGQTTPHEQPHQLDVWKSTNSTSGYWFSKHERKKEASHSSHTPTACSSRPRIQSPSTLFLLPHLPSQHVGLLIITHASGSHSCPVRHRCCLQLHLSTMHFQYDWHRFE